MKKLKEVISRNETYDEIINICQIKKKNYQIDYSKSLIDCYNHIDNYPAYEQYYHLLKLFCFSIFLIKMKNLLSFWEDHLPDKENYLLSKNSYDISNLECSFYLSNINTAKAHSIIYEPGIITNFYLKSYDIISLCNNHITDGGIEAINFIENELKKNDVKPIGTKKNIYIDLKISNRIIRIVSCMINSDKYSSYLIDVNEVLSKSSKLRKGCSFLILYIHWGYESEYIPLPEPSIVKLAKKLIDNGIDLIIGSHPHIPQVYEIYKNRHIYYSIGNANFKFIEGEKYSLTHIGVVINMDINENNFFIDNKCFNIDEVGNVTNFNNLILKRYSCVNNKCYFLNYYFYASETYLKKNIQSFLIRVKKNGIKQLIIFIGWLLFPKTIIYMLFYIISSIFKFIKKTEEFYPFLNNKER